VVAVDLMRVVVDIGQYVVAVDKRFVQVNCYLSHSHDTLVEVEVEVGRWYYRNLQIHTAALNTQKKLTCQLIAY
jgi:hypothetical protein